MVAQLDKSISYVVMGPPNNSVVWKSMAFCVVGPNNPGVVRKSVAYAVVQLVDNVLGFVNLEGNSPPALGWTITSGTPQVSAFSGAYRGDKYFFGGVTAAAAMEQVVTIPGSYSALVASGHGIFTVDIAQSSFSGSDEVSVEVQVLTAADAVIQSHTTVMSSTPGGLWRLKVAEIPVPPTSAKLKILMEWDRDDGTNSDGRIQILNADIVSRSLPVGLQNPSADTGDLTGWTIETGLPVSNTFDTSRSTHNFQLSHETVGSPWGRLTQFFEFTSSDKSNIQASTQALVFEGYIRSFDNRAIDDQAMITVDIFADDGVLIESMNTGWDSGASYELHTMTSAGMPSNAAFVKVTLDGEFRDGSISQAIIDDLSYSFTGASIPNFEGRKASTYAVIEPGPSGKGFKTSAYVVLQLGAARGAKTSTYAVLQFIPHIQGMKSSTYAVIKRPPQIDGRKMSTYVVVQPQLHGSKTSTYIVMDTGPQFAGRKHTSYAVVAPPPPAMQGLKHSQYAVMKPKPPVQGRKNSAYAVLVPPPPFMKGMKSSFYAVVQPKPPVIGTKNSVYTVLEPKPPVKGTKTSTYAVLATPPISARGSKNTVYAVIGGGFMQGRKSSTYAVVLPLGVVGVRATKHTTYAVLQQNNPTLEPRLPYPILLGW